jgi:hypothetical protein
MNVRIIKTFPLIILALLSCDSGNYRRNADVSKVKIEKVQIGSYEQALFSIDKSKLKAELLRLQPDYPMFLAGDLNDSSNLKRISDYLNDTLLMSVFNDSRQSFSDLSWLEAALTESFKYYKFYYPDRILPRVFTYISGFYYEYPVQIFEGNMVVAIDMYLGTDYPRYKTLGLPKYTLRRFSKEYITRDCMYEMARMEINNKRVGTALLDRMINEGKLVWFTNAMLPQLPETILLDYSKEQWDWAKSAEGIVWAFLIENELLYSREMQPVQKFIGDGPFTSFFGAESPPRLGVFVGWRIITSFMNKNLEVTPHELMNNYNAQEILNQSGYKPMM